MSPAVSAPSPLGAGAPLAATRRPAERRGESERWVGHGSRIARKRGGFAGFAFSLLPRDAERDGRTTRTVRPITILPPFAVHACPAAEVSSHLSRDRSTTSARGPLRVNALREGQRRAGVSAGYSKGWRRSCLRRGLIRDDAQESRRRITRRAKGHKKQRSRKSLRFL
jgi:hypothetical protein